MHIHVGAARTIFDEKPRSLHLRLACLTLKLANGFDENRETYAGAGVAEAHGLAISGNRVLSSRAGRPRCRQGAGFSGFNKAQSVHDHESAYRIGRVYFIYIHIFRPEAGALICFLSDWRVKFIHFADVSDFGIDYAAM